MIVRLDANGAVVTDADDTAAVHVETALDADGLRTALLRTGIGTVEDPTTAVLDVAVLRSQGTLAATLPDWAARFDAMIAEAGDRLTGDGRGLRVPVEQRV